MSRISLSRVKRLETAERHFGDASQLSDEDLLAVCCNHDPERITPVLVAYRAGGLEAAGEELLKASLGDEPDTLSLAIEADRRGDFETVARILEERYARAV
jgi:hypothetical protein